MVFQGVLQSHPQKQNGLVNQVDFGGLRHTLTTVKHFVSDPLKKRYGCLSRDKKTFTIVGEVLCNLEISLVFARISLRISTLLIRAFLTRRCVWAGHETVVSLVTPFLSFQRVWLAHTDAYLTHN